MNAEIAIPNAEIVIPNAEIAILGLRSTQR